MLPCQTASSDMFITLNVTYNLLYFSKMCTLVLSEQLFNFVTEASTTLMRFHLKTHRFRYVFTSQPHCIDRKRRPSFSETETFENASESGDI